MSAILLGTVNHALPGKPPQWVFPRPSNGVVPRPYDLVRLFPGNLPTSLRIVGLQFPCGDLREDAPHAITKGPLGSIRARVVNYATSTIRNPSRPSLCRQVVLCPSMAGTDQVEFEFRRVSDFEKSVDSPGLQDRSPFRGRHKNPQQPAICRFDGWKDSEIGFRRVFICSEHRTGIFLQKKLRERSFICESKIEIATAGHDRSGRKLSNTAQIKSVFLFLKSNKFGWCGSKTSPSRLLSGNFYFGDPIQLWRYGRSDSLAQSLKSSISIPGRSFGSGATTSPGSLLSRTP
jgi:hypothetical protein